MSFVSIREVHQAIAAKVQVPSREIDAFDLAEVPETRTVMGIESRTFGILGRESFLSSLRYRYAKSEAARQLDQVLNNAVHFGRQLHWVDRRENANGKVNPKAADDLLPALVDLGKHFARCRKEHFEGNSILYQEIYSLWDFLDPRRLDEVGFIAEQIVATLDEAGVAHSLPRVQVTGLRAIGQSSSSVAPTLIHLIDAHITSFDDLYEAVLNEGLRSLSAPKELRRLASAIWRTLEHAADNEAYPSFLGGVGKKEVNGKYFDCIWYEGPTGDKDKAFLKTALKKRLERNERVAAWLSTQKSAC